MKTIVRKTGFLIAVLSVFVMASLTMGGHANAASAGLSTDTLNLAIDENGSVKFSGNDGGKELKFVWTFPKGLEVTRGAKSKNLDEFKVKRKKRQLKIETDGKGSFSAEIVLSSDNPGTYVLSNKKAAISFSPDDVTVTVAAGAAASAGLSTDTLNLSISENGSVTFSGNDGGKELKFEWTFPKELEVARGAKSKNLDEFKVKRKKRRLKIETDGKGSFSAEIVLSSDNPGTYVLSNKKAAISFSPDDVTVTVAAGGPPPPGPPPPTPDVTFTLRVCEGATWQIRANMVLSDLYLFGDGPCGSSTTLPGPEIRVNEGGTVSIKLINDASNDHYHALIFPGLNVAGAGVAVKPGDEMTYVLPTGRPGTFYYAAAELDMISPAKLNIREIDRGMYGGIVVQSPNERHVRPEHDAIRFFDEIPRVVAGGDISFDANTIVTVPGEAGHKSPTYLTHEFLVNGITIDSKVEGNNLETVVMHGEVGEDTLMRMICVGSETHALHLHGHLVDATGDGLTTDAGGAIAAIVPTDVVRCPSGDVRNLYVAVRAPGTWVWHCHRETHLLNNLDADYPGGMFTHLDATGSGKKDD